MRKLVSEEQRAEEAEETDSGYVSLSPSNDDFYSTVTPLELPNGTIAPPP